ncbi:MAG: nucleotide exchange factor GrpE [Clostridia bacterium]|nr:nucleotide exchange factor GrpE [Clostridia bacterium]
MKKYNKMNDVKRSAHGEHRAEEKNRVENVSVENNETVDETPDFEALNKSESVGMLNEYYSLIEELNKTVAELKAELDKVKAEAAANKDSWYRTAAEFENFKKRNAETRQTAYFDGKKDAINLMLVIGDSVDRALSVEMDEKTRAGVTLIKKQFSETLAAMNVEEIDPVGEKFDPGVAEAIATVEGDESLSDTVKTVYKKGYRLNGKMLRYAQVIVIK